MSGQRPPEWDDDFHEETGQPHAGADARLSEVASYLASVPAPLLPEAVEARISAAIAAEAATRAAVANGDGGDGRVGADRADRDGRGGQDKAVVRSRTLGPAPARARVRRRALLGRLVIGPLVVCLLVGFGYLVSRSGSSSSSSAAAPAAGSSAVSRPQAGPAAVGRSGSAAAGADRSVPAPAAASPAFVVTESGTSYQRATLAGQVRARLIADAAGQAAPTPDASSASASASSSASAGTLVPTATLRGCVLGVVDGAAPRLVDRASYDGTPAYIIASSSRVWVVGLGCTAAKHELITSVPLAG